MSTVWRTEDVDPAAARWLMSAAGVAVLHDLVAGADTADPLAVGAELREQGLEPARAAAAQGVAAASRAAWMAGHPDGTWWTPAAAEQATHPVVAAWRAARHDGLDCVDVTAGCGGDSLALAGHAGRLLACEVDEARVPLLRANLDGRAATVCADAGRPVVPPGRWHAWADPGRRVGGRRVRGLGATVPAVPALVDLGYRSLGIAVSPALDLDDPARPADAELEFVQVGTRLVEATLWLGEVRDRAPPSTTADARGAAVADASATLLPGGDHVRGEPTGPIGDVRDVGAWLLEPAPALVRARLADRMAADRGAARLARRRALFTADDVVRSPWFRCEQVAAVVAARPRSVRDALRALDEQPVEIVTHGLSADVDGWWRALGRPPRGPRGHAVHLVRLDEGSRAVITRRG